MGYLEYKYYYFKPSLRAGLNCLIGGDLREYKPMQKHKTIEEIFNYVKNFNDSRVKPTAKKTTDAGRKITVTSEFYSVNSLKYKLKNIFI